MTIFLTAIFWMLFSVSLYLFKYIDAGVLLIAVMLALIWQVLMYINENIIRYRNK